MIQLLLVRHCQSSGQSPDAPLTEAGHRQAGELAESLRDVEIDLVVSSPYRRAVQSIAPLAESRGLAIRADALLRERELAEVPLDDWMEHLDRSFADLDYRHPTGESGREAQERGWAAIDRIADSGCARAVVATHGNLLSLVLKRLDPSIGSEFWRHLSNPDVYRLERCSHGTWSMQRIWKGTGRSGGVAP